MIDYNFYSDHIEVVCDGQVILDSRTCSMSRILDELYYDFSISEYPTNSKSRENFDSLTSIIATLSHPSSLGDVDLVCILSNLFIISPRRNFGHFHVHFITSK